MTTPSSRVPLLMGVATCGIALVLTVVISVHPESLRAPGWIAYLTCLSIGAAGAAVIARSYDRGRLADALVCVLLASFAVIGYWIAFGPGARTCSMNAAGYASAGGALACRVAFGVGATVVTLLFLIAVRALSRARPNG